MSFLPIMGQTSSYGLSAGQRALERPCRRGCCWSPYGHSAAAVNCTCHAEVNDDGA